MGSTTASTTPSESSGGQTGLQLLVVQPTSLCNLDCGYCYVPDRLDRARLDFDLLGRLLRATVASSLVARQRRLRILWHAGEPLAAGLDYFARAFDLVDQEAGARFEVRHAIQTNATLITAGWCDLFQARRVSLGVSIDGPADIHDANRKTHGGRGSFKQVMRGIELLSSRGIPISALSVLSSANIDRPDDMFGFFTEHDIRRVAFNVEEIEGPNLESSLLAGENPLSRARSRYRAFMTRFAELNMRAGWPIGIREFMSLGERVRSRRADPAYVPVLPERRLGSILTMTRDGDLFSWSPELASLPPARARDVSLGNIRDVTTIDDLLATDRARMIQEAIDQGEANCRATCQYFGVCGGGSPGNKLYERGSFQATETLKCALQTQELTEVMLELLRSPALAVAGALTVA